MNAGLLRTSADPTSRPFSEDPDKILAADQENMILLATLCWPQQHRRDRFWPVLIRNR